MMKRKKTATMRSSTALEIGPPRSTAELRSFCEVFREALWPPSVPNVDLDLWAKKEGKENIRIARKNGAIVGGYSVQKMGQWFGGRSVPMGGVRAVCVAAEHRAGGVGTQLMRHCVEQIHRDGLPIATLYPATQEVYRRVGYEKAGAYRKYRVLTKLIDVRDRTLSVRRVEKSDHAIVHELYAQRARGTAGNADRSPWLWGRMLTPAPWMSPVVAFLVERSELAEGYVVWTLKQGASFHDNEIDVSDIVALTPGAGRRIWSLLADHRSISKGVSWTGPPNDPLLYLLDEQVFEITEARDWMVRIVDVASALKARGYAPGVLAEVVLNVRDDVLPHNNGRFLLRVESGEARVIKAEKAGRANARRSNDRRQVHELSLDIRGLAALYTGHLSAHELLPTGYIDAPEKSGTSLDAFDSALRCASAIFAGPAPWMPEIF